VGLVALDIGNETDATRITFKLRGVETVVNHLYSNIRRYSKKDPFS
jgi:hypothetical protein